MTQPVAFENLNVAELRRAAVEDFAVAVEAGDSKKLVIAALAEAGVTWADYVAQHPEVAPEPEKPVATLVAPDEVSLASRENELDRGGVVKSPVATSAEALSVEADAAPVIHVATEPVARAQDKFLIKMERDNPLYEVRGYRFTSANPYALVSTKDASYILRHEDGFRQAYPDELEEFYG